MPKIKKGWLIVISLVLFLILTNPHPDRFTEFDKDNNAKLEYNFILFSLYQTISYHQDVDSYYTDTYLGIALNFFKIVSHQNKNTNN